MTWLGFAFIGLIIWSATAVADRYFLKRLTNTRAYVIVPALLHLPLALLLVPFMGPLQYDVQAIVAAVLAGIAEAFFLYYFFIAISKEEISRVFPLVGLSPILTLIVAWLFLGEMLHSAQAIAFILFIIGGLLLGIKLGGKGLASVSMSKALRPLLIGSGVATFIVILLKVAFVQSDFWTGFFYSRVGIFCAGAAMFVLWRRDILSQWKGFQTVFGASIIGNQAIAFSGHFFYFTALSLASVALVESTTSFQSALVFLMALVVSWWNPALLGESLKWRDVIQKALGIAFVMAALYLLTALG